MRRGSGIWVAIAAAAALAGVAAPASAGTVVKERLHFEGAEPLAGFCGTGLTVDYAYEVDVALHVVPHGPDGLEYYTQHAVWHETFTNPNNGKTVTGVAKVLEKDKQVIDHGDGSLTVVVLATGNATAYGPDGKAIARNPGQLRYLLTVAADGSITFGDVVKGSTGRSDDFCEAALAALA